MTKLRWPYSRQIECTVRSTIQTPQIEGTLEDYMKQKAMRWNLDYEVQRIPKSDGSVALRFTFTYNDASQQGRLDRTVHLIHQDLWDEGYGAELDPDVGLKEMALYRISLAGRYVSKFLRGR